MEPFQQRVIDERNKLNEKRSKLQTFFETETFLTLDGDEKDRMRRQLDAMTEYAAILQERISAF